MNLWKRASTSRLERGPAGSEEPVGGWRPLPLPLPRPEPEVGGGDSWVAGPIRDLPRLLGWAGPPRGRVSLPVWTTNPSGQSAWAAASHDAMRQSSCVPLQDSLMKNKEGSQQARNRSGKGGRVPDLLLLLLLLLLLADHISVSRE